MAWFPSTTPDITPVAADIMLLADISNANEISDATVQEVVLAWLWANTSDDLPQWATNLYFSTAEQTKLAGITAGAQPNAVISVNGKIWTVILDMDDLVDWTSYVRSENNFDNTAVSELNTAFTHVTNITNPHSVTNTQVGLWNVTNDAQLKRSANDFNTFPQKVSLHPTDIVLIEDSIDSYNKKKVEISDLSTEVIDALATSNSLEVVWSVLELKNDQATPAEDTYFGNQDWGKWRFKKYERNTYPSTTDINIPTGYSMVIHWWLAWAWVVDWPGLLYIL